MTDLERLRSMKRNKSQSLHLLGPGDFTKTQSWNRIKFDAPTTPGGLPDRRGQCEGQREPVERKGWTVRIVLTLVELSGKCDSYPFYVFVS